MGRTKTNAALNLLRGNPGKRVTPAGRWLAPADIPVMPASLTPLEQKCWARIEKEFGSILVATDQEAMKMLAESMAEMELARMDQYLFRSAQHAKLQHAAHATVSRERKPFLARIKESQAAPKEPDKLDEFLK